MISSLNEAGISAERKSIYDDIECLRLFGLDVCSIKAKSFGYYIGERDFELPELKLLVDSVQSSKFITHKKSLELIKKIEHLTSASNARMLQRQVFVSNRVKTMNEKIYYNVDIIHDAIAKNRQISFLYFEWGIDKCKHYRKDGARYDETPVSLSWDDENYYLIVYKEKYSAYAHYRVDKMEQIEISEAERVMPDDSFDLAKYAQSVFGMFGGEQTTVTIRFSNDLVNPVIDRFGSDIPIIKSDDEHFEARVNVKTSRNFYGWIFSFGEKAKIISPPSAVSEAKNLLNNILNKYEEE